MRRYYIVKDDSDYLVAIFTNKDDCEDFIDGNYSLYYAEVVI